VRTAILARESGVGKFSYSQATLATIEASLSAPRLAPYRAQTTTIQEAVDLYVWNEMLAAAFYGPLRIFEVVLRNALHRQLEIAYSADWTADAQFRAYATSITTKDLLRDPDHARIDIAKRRAGAVHINDIVASLQLGYWTTMIDRNFEPGLWAPTLHKAFPHFKAISGTTLSRKPVAARINDIRLLRNNISHNEPLIKRINLQRDYANIIEAISWMTPCIDDWVDHHSRVMSLIELRGRPKYHF
jgi:hypothetical protein